VALEDLALVSKKSDLKQSRSAKSKDTAKKSLGDIGLTRQSMVTLNSSPETSSEQMELFQTSSSVDIPASLSASQVVKEAKKTKDISGQKCIDLYESCGLDGSFARMLVDTLNSVSTRYSLHWRLKDTPSGRLLFQRALSMPRTKETGSGLWLTPTAVQTDEHPDKMKARMAKYPNGTTVGSLTSQVKYAPPMWATPSANTGSSINPDRQEDGWAWNGIYWTRDDGQKKQTRLTDQVRMWPTARASEYKTVPKNRFYGSKTYRGNLGEAVRTSEADGHLNPTWVEWLMGFPTGHTELKHWVTRSSRKSRKSSDK